MQNPESRFYRSHGLRLHYVDWGNDTAPPLLLIHGGRDHARSWDHLARALRQDFHVVAPDLRGHGDSDWSLGGSYSLPEYVYDLTRLPPFQGRGPITVIGHSMGGMVSLIYAGTFPEQVSRLVVLDGITVLPDATKAPAHERTRKWIDQLEALEQRSPRRYRDITEAAAQMQAHNTRLSPELALHLATHGAKQNADGSYAWKFDPYQRVMAPHRLWPDDHVELWRRITCPTLLMFAGESFLRDAAAAGITSHFPNARAETVEGAGHWLQHDKPDEVLRLVREFLLG
ncbi:alpha/beta fold hydrolase [Rhodopseudomonas sp.]|uniref:alpha/beta fold hydrolase n=1 Tax=Rhodopseudomonas sp. TaxID=1078 RepID=UPI003B3B401D